MAHDPLDKTDVQTIADEDIWPAPPSYSKITTNPNWALKSHITHITEAVDYDIPAKLNMLATKGDLEDLATSIAAKIPVGPGISAEQIKVIFNECLSESGLLGLLPGQ